MTVPIESPLQVGDLVSFGVSHPCLTFDKWQHLYVVDDNYNVISAIRTFFSDLLRSIKKKREEAFVAEWQGSFYR